MPDVVIIQRIFPQYRKEIFDELHSKVDFVLLHSKNNSGISQASAPYAKSIRSFKYGGKETNCFLNAFGYIRKKRPGIIIHEFSLGIVSLFPTYLWARIMGSRFILWGHGYDTNKGFNPKNSFKDRVRLFMLKRADAVIFYGKTGRDKIAEFVDPGKLFIAFNCLNTKKLTAIRDSLDAEGRENSKNRIGFNHAYNLIFIGRMLRSKHPQILVEIYEHLEKDYGNALAIHFIGNGEYLDELKKSVEEKKLTNNIYFYGAVQDDVKNGEFLYCSDLMIMPGYVGLSVNHAFNFDCPVVTYSQKDKGPFHSPEIEYLINEKTGYVVEDHSSRAMAETIAGYLGNEKIQQEMKSGIRLMIKSVCSVDNFVQSFSSAIGFVNKKHNRN